MVAPPKPTWPARMSDFIRLRESSGTPPASSLSSLSPASWDAVRTVKLSPLSVVLAPTMTTDWTKTASLLKAIVIGLGVLILLGVALIVFEMIGRAGKVGAGSSDAYVEAALKLPPGSRVVGMTADGDLLSLLVEDSDARQWVMTVDRRSGAVLGILRLEAER